MTRIPGRVPAPAPVPDVDVDEHVELPGQLALDDTPCGGIVWGTANRCPEPAAVVLTPTSTVPPCADDLLPLPLCDDHASTFSDRPWLLIGGYRVDVELRPVTS